MKKKNSIDDITLKRLQKETDFGVIVLGNGVMDYYQIQCTNCGERFHDFEKHFDERIRQIVPACPKCKVHMFTHEFLPLDKSGKVIK